MRTLSADVAGSCKRPRVKGLRPITSGEHANLHTPTRKYSPPVTDFSVLRAANQPSPPVTAYTVLSEARETAGIHRSRSLGNTSGACKPVSALLSAPTYHYLQENSPNVSGKIRQKTKTRRWLSTKEIYGNFARQWCCLRHKNKEKSELRSDYPSCLSETAGVLSTLDHHLDARLQ